MKQKHELEAQKASLDVQLKGSVDNFKKANEERQALVTQQQALQEKVATLSNDKASLESLHTENQDKLQELNKKGLESIKLASSAATIKMTMSVTCAPLARIAVKAS